jgi:hypothetical protein
MATINSINLSSDGVVVYDGAGSFSGTTIASGDMIYGTGANTLSTISAPNIGSFMTFGSIPRWSEPNNTIYIWEDFLGTNAAMTTGWNLRSSSSGAVLYDQNENGHYGTIKLHTSTNASAKAMMKSTRYGFRPGNGPIRGAFLIKINALSDGTDTFVIDVGCSDADNEGSTQANGIYFYYTHSANSGNWICRCRSSSTDTDINTSTAPVANTWTLLEFEVNAGGTSVEFFIDQSSEGSTSTNIPSAASSCGGPYFRIVKSAGTTERQLFADFALVYQQLTSDRF